MKKLGLLFLFLFTILSADLFAQEKNQEIWRDYDENYIRVLGERQIVPDKYRFLKLDVEKLKTLLDQAPVRFTDEANNQSILFQVPMPDGSTATFDIQEAPMMEAALAAEFPGIKTYAGFQVDKPYNHIRFDITPFGFHAMMRSPEENVYIDPYSTEDTEHYVCYYRKDYTRVNDFNCEFEGEPHFLDGTEEESSFKNFAGDCQLRSYRLAVATTGEYTNFHGGSVAQGQAAVVVAINRVNEVYETDLGVTMVLIGNNSSIVYTNGNTDPYTNNSGGTMLGENQSNIDNVIGSNNYDVGHVFSTGGGGVANLNVPCTNSKARGVTGLGSPINDPFYIDYVAHEVGHQFGANHTFNNSCGGNRNNSTAVEPGSASTIMGYAGICNPNVQNNSDDFFHAISIEEITNNIVNGNSSSCPTDPGSNNSQPSVDNVPNYNIPVSTPFVLTAVATDGDSDALTYCWEQMDVEIANMPPEATNTGGPAFRSNDPIASPSRYFPALNTVVNNSSSTWEVLPSVGRDMNFRVTVRDNHPGHGCTDEDNVEITTIANAGPFLVTYPNTNVTWEAGTNETVTWDVAGTDGGQVNCDFVDIRLSTDGGFTYPIVLASNVSNDGSHSIVVPVNPGNSNRVQVFCSDNVFYDISNTNFTIEVNQPSFTFQASPSSQGVCSGDDATFSIPISAFGGFNNNVNLSASGQPAGSTVNFSPNPVSANGTSTMTLSNTSGVANGLYTITIGGTGGGETKTTTVEILFGTPGATTLSSPGNGADNQALSPTLEWTAVSGANDYNVVLATDAGFNNIIESTSNFAGIAYTPAATLDPFTTYYWQVTTNNGCGSGAVSSTFSFETSGLEYCDAAATNTDFEWIESVTVADLTNDSGNNGGYEDFTNLVANLEQGSTYNVSLEPGYENQTFDEYWRIWIDYNKNGDFDDVNELVFDAGSAQENTVTGSFTVGASVATGTTTMRVIMYWTQNGSAPESCEEYQYGEVEDYSVNIAANCPDADNDGVCDSDDTCPGFDDTIDTNNNGLSDDCEPVAVNLSIFLEGAYLPGANTMKTALNIQDLIPYDQPYSGSPYNYSGNESLSSIPSQMVDWVMVDARSGSTSTDLIETKAGLLLADGSIVGMDGSSALLFDLPSGGSYYFVVRHRNHLDVMTANALPRALVMNYDFTSSINQAFGPIQQKVMLNGKAALFAGDLTQDHIIQVTDYDVWQQQPAILDTYSKADANLDGTVQTTDYDLWFANKAKNGPSELAY